MSNAVFETLIRRYQSGFHPVIKMNRDKDRLLVMDFTDNNTHLTADVLDDTAKFAGYIEDELKQHQAAFGIGGYGEHRAIYSRSKMFDATTKSEEPRRLHLGIDIWGPAGTPVYAFMGGMVHSVAFNDHYGDYGATLILLHQLDAIPFYTLYGHISLRDIQRLSEGNYVTMGEEIAHFGEPVENGHWPPHLHFQVIMDMEFKEGDYPGVCKYSERERYLSNCPDPDLILQLMPAK